MKKVEAQHHWKRVAYYRYGDELCAKIANYANMNGNKAAVVKFSSELGHDLSESTVRNTKKAYLSKLKEELDPDNITSLHHVAKGRPLMRGSYDKDIESYVQSLRIAGGIVNCFVAAAAAKGIVAHKNLALLREYGGPIDIGCCWAETFLRHKGYVKGKATKAARKLPPDFPAVKLAFLQRIKDEVEKNSIPHDLIINSDQTGSKLVPVSVQYRSSAT